MLLRLTSPETFDKVIDYLEKERHLQWPNLGTEEPYRDWFIKKTKEEMKTDTVFLNVEWEYDTNKDCIVASAGSTQLSEMLTDEKYLKGE